MIAAFLNIIKIKELRNRLLFTAGIIILVRVASAIPCPGVDPTALKMFIDQLMQSEGGAAPSPMLGNLMELWLGSAPFILA